MTAPVACPSRSWMGATESSIGISSPSRRMRTQFERQVHGSISADRDLRRIVSMVSRLWRPGSRNTSAMGRPPPPAATSRVIFSATTLRKVILPEMSVQITASPMQLSVTWARSFSANSASSSVLALDGIAQGPQQP